MVQKNFEARINYSCGCGFTSQRADEAVKHTESTKHTVGVHGEIRHREDPPVLAKAASSK